MNANQRILIVEDDSLSAEFMKIFLEGEGHTVRTANSFTLALEAYDSFKPNIVITDIQLGDGNGNELGEKFKERGLQKIIAISGYAGAHCPENAVKSGCFDHILGKPVDLQQLTAAIGSV